MKRVLLIQLVILHLNHDIYDDIQVFPLPDLDIAWRPGAPSAKPTCRNVKIWTDIPTWMVC